MTTTVKAPGKLFLAGEYAVTSYHQPSVVIAVNRYVSITISKRHDDDIIITSNKLGVRHESLKNIAHANLTTDWRIVLRSIQLFLHYLTEEGVTPTGFELTISDNLTFHGHKLGLGSSGALTVALINALFKEYDIAQSKLERFKLAALILLTTPDFHIGSMGDVAAATYGGTLHYERFDPQPIMTWLAQKLTLHKIIQNNWPALHITPLQWPQSWRISFGWTGKPASTQSALKKISAADQQQAKSLLLKESFNIVNSFIHAIQQEDYLEAIRTVQQNQHLLITYTHHVGIRYVTPELNELLQVATKLDVTAKISGAGGGDNGFALIKDIDTQQRLEEIWLSRGILPLPLTIAPVL